MNTTQPASCRPSGRRPVRRLVIAAALVTTSLAGTSLAGAGTAEAVNPTEVDVMAWLDAVSPAITVDQSNTCMNGAANAVAYRNDRVVVRTTSPNNSIGPLVNSTLNTLYGTVGVPYVDMPNIERITFPTPSGFGPIVPVVSVALLPRPGAVLHDIVGLSRRLRELGKPSSPDYAMAPSGPYTYYFPRGYPEKTASVTTPRTNVTGGGAPIGTGVRVWVTDTGLAPTIAGELPTTSLLTATDNELPNKVLNDGDNVRVDYPHAVHGRAIAGVITTASPGATIQMLRVNQRDGLLTDVDAARRIAQALRTVAPVNYPALIVAAYGTAVCDLNPPVPGGVLQPIGTEAVVEVVDKLDVSQPRGMLIVASAGNIATTRPHYPAAFPTVLSVGALDGTIDADGSPWTSTSKTAPVAEFSNTGAWVDVYGLGVALPTTHARGLRFEDGGDIIQGAATVSGSSFSGPLVGGHIAELMSQTGLRARAASAQLIAGGARPLPKCTTQTTESGTAIVLGTFNGNITDSPSGLLPTC